MNIGKKVVFAIVGTCLLAVGGYSPVLAEHSGPPPHAPAHGHRAKHEYRYYPRDQVYFDPGRKVYFYKDGKKWRKVFNLPKRMRLAPDYVVIDMDDAKPYREFHRHREMYPRHYRMAREYRYYPEDQVYFDPGRGVYFYLEGPNWQVAASLPKWMRLAPDYVVIDMDDDKPYREFDRHRERYPRHHRRDRDEHRRAAHEYRYYPDEQVYFDPGRKVYFYLEGPNWQVAASLPKWMRLAPDFVVIDMDDDKPYREFDRHRERYPRHHRDEHERDRDRHYDHDRNYDHRGHDDDGYEGPRSSSRPEPRDYPPERPSKPAATATVTIPVPPPPPPPPFIKR